MWIEIGGSLVNTHWIGTIKRDGHCIRACDKLGSWCTLLKFGADNSEQNQAQAKAEFERIKGLLLEAKR